MTWFAFPGGWGVYNLNGIAEKELAATGAHGYATEAQANAHVNAGPSPAQQALLQLDKASSVSPVGAGSTGVLKTPSSTGGVSGAASNLLGNLRYTLNIGNTTGLLTRFLKVLIGGVVMLAGILKLTNTDKTLADVLPLLGGPAGKVLRA